MGSFSAIAVFPLLLLLVRGQFTTVPATTAATTGPVPATTGPVPATTGPVPATTAATTGPVPATTGPVPATTGPVPATTAATTGPIPTLPPVATTGTYPVTPAPTTPSQPPDKRVIVNLNLKLRAPSTIDLSEVDAAIYSGTARLENILQIFYNVKSLRIIDMESEDPSEVFY